LLYISSGSCRYFAHRGPKKLFSVSKLEVHACGHSALVRMGAVLCRVPRGTAKRAKMQGESPSLEVFKNHTDVAPRDMISGHGGDGQMTGTDDLRRLFQP